MPGRPRDPELEKRLLSAAWSLLSGEGYDNLRLTQVAARAKAHRTDVYRRWPSKAQLVTAVLAEHLPPMSEVDTGALLSDLRAYLDDLAATWADPCVDGLVGLLADLRHDPAAESAFRAMSDQRSQPLVNVIAHAVRRGEIVWVPELLTVGNLLEGPLMHRQLFGRRAATAEDLDAIADSAHRLLTATKAVK